MRKALRRFIESKPAIFRPIWRVAYPVLLRRPERWAGEEYTGSRAEAFDTIYRENRWANAESVSGSGSTMFHANMMQSTWDRAIAKTGARTILDAPCGDFNWMQHIKLPENTRYIGGEIVADLARGLQDKFGSSHRSFAQMDIASDALPAAELWLCRHVLFHLSLDDIAEVLRNFTRSDVKYILADDFRFPKSNTDIQSGGFRFINLRIAPFNLPKPLATYPNFNPPEAPSDLNLWSRDQVSEAISRWPTQVRR